MKALLGAGALLALAVPAAVVAQQPGPSPYATPAPATAPVPSKPAEPRPSFRRTFVARPYRGRVLVKEPGDARYAQLTETTELALGTSVDARRGRVRIIVARDDEGHTYRANFFSGKFNVTQDDASPPLTTIVLAGGSYAETCTSSGTTARASAVRRSRRKVRRLWADGRGRFRTRGRYSAATVRGTRWLTEDRCDGTLTRVARGAVIVEDFTETETPAPGAAPAPTPEPDPTPAPPPGPDGAPPPTPQAAPAPAQGERGTPRRRNKRLRVRRGQVYVASPHR